MPVKIIHVSEKKPLALPTVLSNWWSELKEEETAQFNSPEYGIALVKVWPWFFPKAKLYHLQNWFYFEINLEAIDLNLRPDIIDNFKNPGIEYLITQLKKQGTLDLSLLAARFKNPAVLMQSCLDKYGEPLGPLVKVYPTEHPQTIYLVIHPQLLLKKANEIDLLGCYLLDELIVSSEVFTKMVVKIAQIYAMPFDKLRYCFPKEIMRSNECNALIHLLFSSDPLVLSEPNFSEKHKDKDTFFIYIDLESTRLKMMALMPYGIYRQKMLQFHQGIRTIIKKYVLEYNLAHGHTVAKLEAIVDKMRNAFLDEIENNSLNTANMQLEKNSWQDLHKEMSRANEKMFADFLHYVGKYALLYSKDFQSNPAYQPVQKKLAEFIQTLQTLNEHSNEMLKLCQSSSVHVENADYFSYNMAMQLDAKKKLDKRAEEVGILMQGKTPLIYYVEPAVIAYFTDGLFLKQTREKVHTQFLVLQQQHQVLLETFQQQYIALNNALLSVKKNIGRVQNQVLFVPAYQAEIEAKEEVTYFNGQLSHKNNPEIIKIEGLINYYIYNQAQYMKMLTNQDKFYLARKHVVGEHGPGLKYIADLNLTAHCIFNEEFVCELKLVYKLKIKGIERLLYAEVTADNDETKLLIPLIYLVDEHTQADKKSLQTSLKNKIFNLSIKDNKICAAATDTRVAITFGI